MMRTSVPGSNLGHLSKTAVDQTFRAPMNRSKSAYFASVLGSSLRHDSRIPHDQVFPDRIVEM
jgi:hypothetical protein